MDWEVQCLAGREPSSPGTWSKNELYRAGRGIWEGGRNGRGALPQTDGKSCFPGPGQLVWLSEDCGGCLMTLASMSSKPGCDLSPALGRLRSVGPDLLTN